MGDGSKMGEVLEGFRVLARVGLGKPVQVQLLVLAPALVLVLDSEGLPEGRVESF